MTRLAILAAAAMLAFSPAQAHIPEKCVDLFHEAGRENEDLVERMNAVFDEIMEYRYDTLADLFSQAYGAYIPFSAALAAAIQCVQEEE